MSRASMSGSSARRRVAAMDSGGGDADGDTARPEARLDGGGVGRQFVRGHGLGGRDGPFAGDAGQRIHLCPRGAPPCRVYYPRHRCGCSLDSASPHRVRWWHRRCPCFSTGHCPLETSRSSGRRREWIRLCPWGFPYCVYYHQLGLTWEKTSDEHVATTARCGHSRSGGANADRHWLGAGGLLGDPRRSRSKPGGGALD